MASSSTSSNRSTPESLISRSLPSLAASSSFSLSRRLAGLFEVLALDGLLLGLDHAGRARSRSPCSPAGVSMRLMRRREPASSMRSMALSGRKPVGDVAVGQVGRGHEGLVGDGDPVVGLVAVAQALQDLDRVGHGGLLDHDLLEAALEGGVLLEVLAVLVERGGADRLQLAAGEHRLQDRRRVDGALGGTGTHEGVELVDEQDDVAAGADLLQHLLEALLEVAAVAGAGHERAEVERVELLALERLGDVVDDDLLGQALDDGGLADAGLADEDRVVLLAARQDLHHALDLLRAADDRVELLLARLLGEVATELVEHERAGGALLALGATGPGRLARPSPTSRRGPGSRRGAG